MSQKNGGKFGNKSEHTTMAIDNTIAKYKNSLLLI